MLSNLGIYQVPVKINLNKVNAQEDSFLDDLELVDFDSSFDSHDDEIKQLQKLSKNMRDFKDEVQINKNVVGDLDIRLRVEESEQQTKKQTDNFRIQNNLN